MKVFFSIFIRNLTAYYQFPVKVDIGLTFLLIFESQNDCDFNLSERPVIIIKLPIFSYKYSLFCTL